MTIKLNKELPLGHHGIRAEVSILPTEDIQNLFNQLDIWGWNHILVNDKHTLINKGGWQIIPCENYQEAQEWCYKFTNKHLMI